MQKVNWREANPHMRMGTNRESCNAETEQYLAMGKLCMMISLEASSQPKVVCNCPSFPCLHSIVTGQVQIFFFIYKKPSVSSSTTLTEPSPHPSIHQQCPIQYKPPPPPPCPDNTTPTLGFDITLLWLSGPLCRLLSEADWRPFVCVSPCPEWPGGTCWAAGGEAGMHVWMSQCVQGICWQRCRYASVCVCVCQFISAIILFNYTCSTAMRSLVIYTEWESLLFLPLCIFAVWCFGIALNGCGCSGNDSMWGSTVLARNE